jgi:REP element-mobilizing transposase RayT
LPDAAQSFATRLEWTSALAREISERRLRLGVVLVRDCDLPQLLRTKQYIDARAEAEKGIRAVLDWLKARRDAGRLAGGLAPVYLPDYKPQNFVGRADYLESLRAALADEPGMFLLTGEPGSGKSTLALMLAWQAQRDFDAVLFQTCGRRRIEEIAGELAERLREQLGEDVAQRPPEEKLAKAKKWLKARRSLLVLDDLWLENGSGRADRPTGPGALGFQDLLPGPPASVLFTSRRPSLPGLIEKQVATVESFTPQEAEEVFRNYLQPETVARHREALLDFAERVERLPIAVTVGADLMRREFGPLTEAARGLALERLRNEVQDVPGLLERAIEAQGPLEQRLLEASAVCAPDCFWLPLAIEIAGLSQTEGAAARDVLVNSSLLRVLDRDRQRFQLHALLREQLRRGTGILPVRAGNLHVEKHAQDAHATPQHAQDAHATPAHAQDAHATSELKIRQGAYLPHWTREGATYSVTFRLADSLPRPVVERWLFEREDISRTARQLGRPLTPQEERRLQELFSERVERYLDAGEGECWMRDDAIAAIVAEALLHFDGSRYLLHAWCVMPNHVHVVVQPLAGYELPSITHSWKSFTAKEANRKLGRRGKFWQPEPYDHLIRDEADYQRQVEYVLNNPARAGLKDWKWVGRGTGILPVEAHAQDAHATPAHAHGTPAHAQDAHGRSEHARDAHATPAQDARATSITALQERHAAVLEGLFKDWETRWQGCRECLAEVTPAAEFLWAERETSREAWLSYWGWALAKRVGELDAALRIMTREAGFWAGRDDREAKDALQRSYGNQALILYAWGRLEEALTLHKKEEAICLELGNKDGLQRSYGNQALILKAWGRLEEALALHKKQEAICLELGSKRELGYCCWQWGLLARAQGDRETEKQKLEAALALFGELKMPRERDAVGAELNRLNPPLDSPKATSA